MSDGVWAHWRNKDFGCSGLHEGAHRITCVEICNSQPTITLRTKTGQFRIIKGTTPLIEQIECDLHTLFRANFTDEDREALEGDKIIELHPAVPIPVMVKMFKEPDQVELLRATPRDYARWLVETTRRRGDLHEDQGNSQGEPAQC